MNIKLSSHLRLGLPSGLFTSGFPIKILYTRTHLLYPIRVTCPAHLILLDLITRKILLEEYNNDTPNYSQQYVESYRFLM